MLRLALLQDFVGIQELSFLLILTPGWFLISVSIWKIAFKHSWLLSASADKTVQLWEVPNVNKLQAGCNQSPTLLSHLNIDQPGKPNIEQQTISSTLTLTGHFMKVSTKGSILPEGLI